MGNEISKSGSISECDSLLFGSNEREVSKFPIGCLVKNILKPGEVDENGLGTVVKVYSFFKSIVLTLIEYIREILPIEVKNGFTITYCEHTVYLGKIKKKYGLYFVHCKCLKTCCFHSCRLLVLMRISLFIGKLRIKLYGQPVKKYNWLMDN